MKRKILRCLWLIPFIAGICLGVVGITKLKQANDVYVPEMTEPGWFDASSKQDSLRFAGISMTVGGFVFLSLIGSMICAIIAKSATTTPEEYAVHAAKQINDEKRFKTKLKELTGKDGEKYLNEDMDSFDSYDDEFGDESDLDFEDENPDYNFGKSKNKGSKKAKIQGKYCDFCGSYNSGDASKCSSCGASFTKKN